MFCSDGVIVIVLQHKVEAKLTVSVLCLRFPPASASYILLQFSQYGNILHHTVTRMHSLSLTHT